MNSNICKSTCEYGQAGGKSRAVLKGDLGSLFSLCESCALQANEWQFLEPWMIQIVPAGREGSYAGAAAIAIASPDESGLHVLCTLRGHSQR